MTYDLNRMGFASLDPEPLTRIERNGLHLANYIPHAPTLKLVPLMGSMSKVSLVRTF